MAVRIRRRDFVLGGAGAVWPFVAHAQSPTMPVIGFLNSTSPDGFSERLRKFSQGLKEQGFVEGENVAIVYRFADNQADRLPELAARPGSSQGRCDRHWRSSSDLCGPGGNRHDSYHVPGRR